MFRDELRVNEQGTATRVTFNSRESQNMCVLGIICPVLVCACHLVRAVGDVCSDNESWVICTNIVGKLVNFCNNYWGVAFRHIGEGLGGGGQGRGTRGEQGLGEAVG